LSSARLLCCTSAGCSKRRGQTSQHSATTTVPLPDVNPHGITVDAELVFHRFQAAAQVIPPAVVHQVAVGEHFLQVNSELAVDERQVEAAAVIGVNTWTPLSASSRLTASISRPTS